MTAKADRVEKLLNNPDLKEAFAVVRERYRDLIEETPLASSDDEALHDIRKMLHLLREVEQSLYKAIEDGHLEDFRANEQQGFLQDIRRWKQ